MQKLFTACCNRIPNDDDDDTNLHINLQFSCCQGGNIKSDDDNLDGENILRAKSSRRVRWSKQVGKGSGIDSECHKQVISKSTHIHTS